MDISIEAVVGVPGSWRDLQELGERIALEMNVTNLWGSCFLIPRAGKVIW